MKESKRKAIARKFLEQNFGKRWKPLSDETLAYCKESLEKGYGERGLQAYAALTSEYNHNFELWKAWESTEPGSSEARAFEVFYAPYLSDAKKQFIAVSDSKEELREIVNQVFDKERIRLGLLEYDEQDGYYVVYD